MSQFVEIDTRYQQMWFDDRDFWKMCILLGVVCASIGAFMYVMLGVVVDVVKPILAAMAAS